VIYSSSPNIKKVDLIKAYFDWNSEEAGSETNPRHSYSITMTSYDPSVFYCEILIKRQGGSYENFLISATYYCKTDQSEKDELAHAMTYHKAFAESIVWSKFSEWARFTLNQGDISNISLPIVPGEVITRNLNT
jgi:hypothetical protein